MPILQSLYWLSTLPTHFSVYLFIYLSTYFSIYLSIYLYICLSTYIYIYIYAHSISILKEAVVAQFKDLFQDLTA